MYNFFKTARPLKCEENGGSKAANFENKKKTKKLASCHQKPWEAILTDSMM